MRKRLTILLAMVSVAVMFALPATAAAGGSPGSFGFKSGYCTGLNTVHATFKLVKYSGYYATKLTMKAQGQGYYNGGWHNEGPANTFQHAGGGYAKTTWNETLKWKPGHSGSHRIKVVAKIWDGGNVIGQGNDVSGYCG